MVLLYKKYIDHRLLLQSILIQRLLVEVKGDVKVVVKTVEEVRVVVMVVV